MNDEVNQQDVEIYVYEFSGEDKKIQLLFSLDRDTQFNVEASAPEIEAAEGWDKNRVLQGKGAQLNDAVIDGVLLPAEQHIDKMGRVTEAWSYRNGKCFGQLSVEEIARLNREKGVAPKIPASLKHLPGAARAVFLTEPAVLAQEDAVTDYKIVDRKNKIVTPKRAVAAAAVVVALTGIFLGVTHDADYAGRAGLTSTPGPHGSAVTALPADTTKTVAAAPVSTPQGVAALPKQNEKSEIIVPPVAVRPNPAAKSLQGVQNTTAKSSKITVAKAPSVSLTEAAASQVTPVPSTEEIAGKDAPEKISASAPAVAGGSETATGTEPSGTYTYKVWGANFFKVYTYPAPSSEQRAALEQNYEKIQNIRGRDKVDALAALGIKPLRVEWVERNGNAMGSTIAVLDVESKTIRSSDGSVINPCPVEGKISGHSSLSFDGKQEKSAGNVCIPKIALNGHEQIKPAELKP